MRPIREPGKPVLGVAVRVGVLVVECHFKPVDVVLGDNADDAAAAANLATGTRSDQGVSSVLTSIPPM